MLPNNDRGRPLAGPALNVIPDNLKPSVTLGADVLRELDALAAHVDGAFVVVVKVSGTHYRRRCYLTAKAAESAARKATERGENVVVYMAELKPLYRLIGGEG